MTDQKYVIELGPDGRAIVDADETPWLEDKVRREPGPTRLRVRADDSDTEGHALQATEVRVLIDEGDDTEGHAISLHFPTVDEADAFRRRLLLTGVLVGTVALGAAGGIGLSALQDQDAGISGAGTVAAADAGQYVPENMGGTIVAGTAAQAGPMDAHEAPAFAAAQAGPMDPAEAGAYNTAIDAGTGQYVPENMGGTIVAGAAANAGQYVPENMGGTIVGGAAAQAGPMDAHEAPAFQGSSTAEGSAWTQDERAGLAAAGANVAAAEGGSAWTQDERAGLAAASSDAAAGPMDAAEAGTYSTPADADEEVDQIGGPQPR
jgi:hypothetical protein